MPSKTNTKENSSTGVVLTATRRHVIVLFPDGSEGKARTNSKTTEVTVGDKVRVTPERKEFTVKEIFPRANCLSRTYLKRTKTIAANLDRILVVAAVPPLLNTDFIDRVLCVASVNDIPATMILNKTDLGISAEANETIMLYQNLGFEVLLTSTKSQSGIDELKERIKSSSWETIAFTGMSGVGKSSLLNELVPQAKSRTNTVSHKTGQGRQTTTQSQGHRYPVLSEEPTAAEREVLIIDLPGIQNFGVSDLTQREVALAFPEFVEHLQYCEYYDCRHLAEPVCGVKTAIAEGLIAESRYESYCNMVQEIESVPQY